METKKQIGFGDWKEPQKLRGYLDQILDSGRLTYGPISEKLESLFSEMNGVKYSIFCSSGTAALFSAIGVLKNLYPERAKKKYIILPATTFISDFNIVKMNGFEPLFVDVGQDYNINYEDLESKVKNNYGNIFAILPSSLMGRPIDGQKINEIIEFYSKDCFFVLDSCENICSKYGGTYPESFAQFTAWSTYISHLLISGACGGFLGTNDEKLAIRARSFINHGRHPGYTNIDSDNNVNEHKLKDITANRFNFIQPGLNFRMGEVEAAFALSMLEDNFEEQLKKRKQNTLRLIEGLSRHELILPKFREAEQNRHMMLPIRVASGTKTELINFLEQNGIETREILPMYQPITEKYFGSKIEFKTNFPNSAEALEKGFYIGCHQYLTESDINYILEKFNEWFTIKI